uniref:Uncharacterized protein n=1 Tax=Arundo donax TaxID=35708 RepID=A0A0A9C045_ARUDO
MKPKSHSGEASKVVIYPVANVLLSMPYLQSSL